MDIKNLISEMTLEEKASLCSGADFWRTKDINRLEIPQMMVSDGPYGLRKQEGKGDHVGINDSIKAVCFPTGVTVASSFDKELIYAMGEQLGESCQAEDVGIILGPAMNIKRSPLCGRNFEYFSEDPYFTGIMASQQIKGIQSKGVGTSIKHYLANSQEYRRMTSDSQIDERTLREIYLPAFEMAVKEAQPWTVMCSYNKINGTYASENYRFLTEVLRDEWGFEGFVMSDWGAVNDRVESIKAGMDLEMPYSFGANERKIIEAVKVGSLEEELLNKTVERILSTIDKYVTRRDPKAVFNLQEQHDQSREIATESMVLLKNENILPINKKDSVAFIGGFAKKPRFQGGGSSHVNTFKESNAYTSALEYIGNTGSVLYADGYSLEIDEVNNDLLEEAVAIAKKVEIAVLFVGLPDAYESEGYDRQHMSLPISHQKLIESVSKVQPNTVIVLHNGSPVEMPWIDGVKAVLEAYLSGQAVGEATVDLLYGEVNPSGKLAETFPLKLEDNPSYLYYLGEKDVVEYREGVFVGYRYYDKKAMEVRFPFGHGLSYTTFKYDNLVIDKKAIKDSELLQVTIDITNVGNVYGKEVVQLYVTPPKGDIIRPVKELKGFSKVSLAPSETKQVTMTLNQRAFAYFDTQLNDWHVESGDYGILIGASSRDIRLQEEVTVTSTKIIRPVYHINSTVGDILINKDKVEVMKDYIDIMDRLFSGESDESSVSQSAIRDEMKSAIYHHMPLRNLISFGSSKITEEQIQTLIDTLNE